MPFLLAEILNFQGSTHRIGVGSFSNLILYGRGIFFCIYADMAELADAPDLGSGILRCAGSSPVIRILQL